MCGGCDFVLFFLRPPPLLLSLCVFVKPIYIRAVPLSPFSNLANKQQLPRCCCTFSRCCCVICLFPARAHTRAHACVVGFVTTFLLSLALVCNQKVFASEYIPFCYTYPLVPCVATAAPTRTLYTYRLLCGKKKTMTPKTRESAPLRYTPPALPHSIKSNHAMPSWKNESYVVDFLPSSSSSPSRLSRRSW